MAVVYEKTGILTDTPLHYCPGCTHGIIHRLVAEAIDELGIQGKTIGIAPVGCAVFAYNYFNTDMMEAAHGRAPAVATGCKRVHPDNIVFTYQGDGDLASIGMGEIIHAAARGEKFSTFFINNGIYGMTGGQMAPTTLIGQRSTTSVDGRTREQAGMPLKICELLATLDGPAYIERVSLDSPAHIRAAKKAVRTAFEVQLAGKGFSFVELLSTCPTNWGLTPPEAMKRMREEVAAYYPLGVYKDTGKEDK